MRDVVGSCLRALRARLSGRGDTGSAVVEFLGVSLMLLVPTVYLIVTLGQIQAATFAAEGAAREAGRLIAQAETWEQGVANASMAVELAFADQGFDVSGSSALNITCGADPCLSPGEFVMIDVSAEVALPLIGGLLETAVVQISADAMAAVGAYQGDG